MKMNFRGEFRNVQEREYDFNGNKGKSYSVTVETEDGSYYLKTTKSVYDLYKNGYLEKGQDYNFVADYMPQFKTLRIVEVQ